MDFSQNLINAAVFGQGNLDLVREKSGKCQGILLAIICVNPVHQRFRRACMCIYKFSPETSGSEVAQW